jgi:hypothetical protein
VLSLGLLPEVSTGFEPTNGFIFLGFFSPAEISINLTKPVIIVVLLGLLLGTSIFSGISSELLSNAGSVMRVLFLEGDTFFVPSELSSSLLLSVSFSQAEDEKRTCNGFLSLFVLS